MRRLIACAVAACLMAANPGASLASGQGSFLLRLTATKSFWRQEPSYRCDGVAEYRSFMAGRGFHLSPYRFTFPCSRFYRPVCARLTLPDGTVPRPFASPLRQAVTEWLELKYGLCCDGAPGACRPSALRAPVYWRHRIARHRATQGRH